MRVVFRYSGDFTGITREAQFEFAQLERDAPALAQALQAVNASPTRKARATTPKPDMGVYEFAFSQNERADDCHTFSRTDLPESLRAHLAILMKAAKPVAPK
jgi:hypothetical protein